MSIDYDKVPHERREFLMGMAAMRAEKKQAEQDLHEKLALNYRYFKFWDDRSNKMVSISVGWRKIESDIPEIEYAIAIQGKKDQFSRKEARKVINQRWVDKYIADFAISNTIKDVDTVIACHYNSHSFDDCDYGVAMIPKFASRIPIYI